MLLKLDPASGVLGVAGKWVNQRRLFVGWQCQCTTSSSSARLTSLICSHPEKLFHIFSMRLVYIECL